MPELKIRKVRKSEEGNAANMERIKELYHARRNGAAARKNKRGSDAWDEIYPNSKYDDPIVCAWLIGWSRKDIEMHADERQSFIDSMLEAYPELRQMDNCF